MHKSPHTISIIAAAMLAFPANAQFVETDVEVLYSVGSDADNDLFSLAPAAIGDINGDGITEIVCTAPGRANDDATVGACFLINGADGEIIRTHPSPNKAVVFQRAAEAGDINGDGIPDYAVGAWGAGVNGSVSVFSGNDGTLLLMLNGLSANDQFGLGLAPLDDVNGDGHADLIVGAPFHRVPNVPRGRVIVFSGADGSELWSLEGAVNHQALGQSCFAVDDADGDGIRDVAVASPQMRASFFSTGPGFVQLHSGVDGTPIGDPIVSPSATSVFFGGWIPSPVIDINGDGTNEIILADQTDFALGSQTGKMFVFDGAARTLLYEMVGSSMLQGLGATANAGDMNNDGLDDLIVTSWRSPDGAPGLSGKLEIRGGLDGELIGAITANTPNGNFGGWVLPMGDVNHDGNPDLFVNAPSHSADGPSRGRFWVISGCSFNDLPSADLGAPFGTLDIGDFFAFIFAFTHHDFSADLMRDGVLNIFDMLAFMEAFNGGCP